MALAASEPSDTETVWLWAILVFGLWACPWGVSPLLLLPNEETVFSSYRCSAHKQAAGGFPATVGKSLGTDCKVFSLYPLNSFLFSLLFCPLCRDPSSLAPSPPTKSGSQSLPNPQMSLHWHGESSPLSRVKLCLIFVDTWAACIRHSNAGGGIQELQAEVSLPLLCFSTSTFLCLCHRTN